MIIRLIVFFFVSLTFCHCKSNDEYIAEVKSGIRVTKSDSLCFTVCRKVNQSTPQILDPISYFTNLHSILKLKRAKDPVELYDNKIWYIDNKKALPSLSEHLLSLSRWNTVTANKLGLQSGIFSKISISGKQSIDFVLQSMEEAALHHVKILKENFGVITLPLLMKISDEIWEELGKEILSKVEKEGRITTPDLLWVLSGGFLIDALPEGFKRIYERTKDRPIGLDLDAIIPDSRFNLWKEFKKSENSSSSIIMSQKFVQSELSRDDLREVNTPKFREKLRKSLSESSQNHFLKRLYRKIPLINGNKDKDDNFKISQIRFLWVFLKDSNDDNWRLDIIVNTSRKHREKESEGINMPSFKPVIN